MPPTTAIDEFRQARYYEPDQASLPSKTKYHPNLVQRCYEMALAGFPLKDMALAMSLAPSTLQKYRDTYPELDAAILKGDKLAIGKVAHSLFRRACGYEIELPQVVTYQGEITDNYTEVKHFPSDTAAAKTFLTNRDPNNWKEKQTIEFNQNHDWVDKLPSYQFEYLMDLVTNHNKTIEEARPLVLEHQPD